MLPNKNDQCKGELIYNSFTIVQIQTFCYDKLAKDRLLNDDDFYNHTLQGIKEEEARQEEAKLKEDTQEETPNLKKEENCIKNKLNDEFIYPFDDCIDRQIFTHKFKEFFRNYEAKGFDIKIEIDDDEKSILEGKVLVRVNKFFNNCIQVTYRIMASVEDKWPCKLNKPFHTDQLISVAGIAQKVEYWDTDSTGKQSIDGGTKKIIITNHHLDKNSVYSIDPLSEEIDFDEIMRRYQNYFDIGKNKDVPYLHTFIDVCENIGHTTIDLDKLSAEDIISHIDDNHKPELMGIMSLYPKEWEYRDPKNYNDICGEDIAIDTDDLVLTNQNVSLIIGTYGKRRNWKVHFDEFLCNYHVSWPEFLTLVEFAIAKKQIINHSITEHIKNAKETSKLSRRNRIKISAKNSLKLSEVILNLNPIRYLRYVSHKHMFSEAERNMRVIEDEKYLEGIINKIDNSLNNTNNSQGIKDTKTLNYAMVILAIFSVIGVIIQIYLIINEKNNI